MLVEIFAEVEFTGGFLPSGSLPDLVPKAKELGFPKIEFGSIRAISLKLQEAEIQQATLSPRIRCWNDDKTKLIQLSEDQVVVNLVGAYPGWKTFTELFGQLWNFMPAEFENSVNSLSLHTIDKHVASEDEYVFGKFFQAGGNFIPTWYKDSTAPCDISLGMGLLQEDGFNRAITLKVRRVADGFALEIRSTFRDPTKSGSQLKLMLEDLHKESNDTFESLITDHTREAVMGGWESNGDHA